MKLTVAETITKITREHLQNGGMACGQCLTAVGWVGGTVPEMTEKEGLIELSVSDVMNGGFAVGLALAGRRPIYIVRYQGFQWLNAAFIINYAAKSKEMWGVPCPIFVRSIAMDGSAGLTIGPSASGSHHGMYTRMPGIPVCAPMTPCEYQSVWDYFMEHDDPVYVSEHRKSFPINYEMSDVIYNEADITLFAISSTRLNALEAAQALKKEGIRCNVIHLLWLKPFNVTEKILGILENSRYGGIILDGDFGDGTAKSIAFDILQKSIMPVRVLALEERTAGFALHLDNLPPSAEKIYSFVRNLLK